MLFLLLFFRILTIWDKNCKLWVKYSTLTNHQNSMKLCKTLCLRSKDMGETFAFWKRRCLVCWKLKDIFFRTNIGREPVFDPFGVAAQIFWRGECFAFRLSWPNPLATWNFSLERLQKLRLGMNLATTCGVHAEAWMGAKHSPLRIRLMFGFDCWFLCLVFELMFDIQFDL